MSTLDEIKARLLRDLHTIGVDASLFDLRIKPYSKTRYGVYRTQTKRVYVYAYVDSECTKLFPYSELLDTAIHESVHAMQWNDPSFERVRGVMHNEEFYVLYEHYKKEANRLVAQDNLEGRCEKLHDEISQVGRRSDKVHSVRGNRYSSTLCNSPVLMVSRKRGV